MQKIFQKICKTFENVGIFAEKFKIMTNNLQKTKCSSYICKKFGFFRKKSLLKEHKSRFALIFALDFNFLNHFWSFWTNRLMFLC